MLPQKDADYHWTACECGYATDKVAHNYNVVNKDADKHWNECSCGAQSNVTAHSYTGWTDIGAGKHNGTCTCGATTTETHTFEGEIQYSETQHWKECKCGVANKMNHFGGSATCTEKAECSTCHQKYGALAPNNHTQDTTFAGIEGIHSKYICCGATASTEHAYETSVKTPATCTVNGTTTYTCECGYSYDSQNIPALEHELAASSFYRVDDGVLYTVTQCVRYGQGGCTHEVKTEVGVAEVNNEADLRLALNAGYSVKLTADIELSEAINITAGTITIDMNGKTLTNDGHFSAADVIDVVWIKGEGVRVTITGEGTMNALGAVAGKSTCVLSATDGAKVVIENGTYYSGGCTTIFATRGGNVTINNGSFAANDSSYLIDIDETDKVNPHGTIIINGGKFKSFNPANHTNDKPVSTNKLADGLHAIADVDNVYTVGAHDYTHHTNVVDPTCTVDGYTRHTCVCGDYYNDSTVTATGHEFDEKVTEENYLKSAANCTDKAVYYFSCHCGECGSETFEHGVALGHDFSNGVSCERCGSEGVVKVNGEYYLSLESALEALTDGATLTFNSNMVLEDALEFNHSVIIDTAGHSVVSTAGKVITIKDNGSTDPITVTVIGNIIVGNASAALMRTGGGALAQTVLTIEDVDNVTVILDAEFDLGAEDIIYNGSVETGYNISVREAYAAHLARHGYITTPVGSGMVKITAKSPYYIGSNDNWWLGNVDTGIKATGTDGSNGTNGKSAYELAVENGYKGTEAEWLAALVGEKGDPGDKGETGATGKSAYELAVEKGYKGTEEEWLEALIGEKGDKGDTGLSAYELAVKNGFEGTLTEWLESLVGAPGIPGKSAYELAVAEGYKGTLAEWLVSLVGDKGDKGDTGLSAYEIAVKNGYKGTELEWLASLVGEQGGKGDTGLSAYEIAVKNGYKGTEAEWLKTLIGEKGDAGKSAYELAKENGYTGTLTEWLESLVGEKGDRGDSAYEIAVKNGYKGTEAEWLNSLVGLRGEEGKSAYDLAKENGFEGTLAEWLDSLVGEDGVDGVDGDSAYDLAVKNGFKGTVTEWLASLVGEKGADGTNGADGKSAYELAVENGYTGTLQQWLASLVGEKGADGADGKSAYDLAVENGYTGTLEEWIASLAGQKGDKGDPGEDGEDGKDGADGKTPYIGENGNWWVGETDLGIPATGNDGESGETPYIGENGNWWIGETDLGIRAEAQDGKSNDYIILLCLGIAGLCILTTIVAVVTKKGRGWRIF